jgi:hypothetical protein
MNDQESLVPEFKDGDHLDEGLVVSLRGNPPGVGGVSVVRCPKCRREQTCSTEKTIEMGFGEWITIEEAEHVGWRRFGDIWRCPFCTGNLDNLTKVWKGEDE